MIDHTGRRVYLRKYIATSAIAGFAAGAFSGFTVGAVKGGGAEWRDRTTTEADLHLCREQVAVLNHNLAYAGAMVGAISDAFQQIREPSSAVVLTVGTGE